MQKLKSILWLACLLIASSSFAQSKIIAVMTKAKWCGICKANEQRAISNFNKNNSDAFFQLLTNDITDKSSKASSVLELEKNGVSSSTKKIGSVAKITFIAADSKKVWKQISISKTDQQLLEAMQKARALVK